MSGMAASALRATSARRVGWFLLLWVLAGARPFGPAWAADSFPYVFETVVSFDPTDFRAVPDGAYQRIGMQGADLDRSPEHIGWPQLPVAVRFVLLPPDRIAESTEIIPVDRLALPDRYQPYPVLSEENPGDGPPDLPPWLPQMYPGRTGFCVAGGPMRRYWLAKLQLWPIEFDGATGQITIRTSFRVRIRTRDLTTDERQSTLHLRRLDGADGPWGEYRDWVRATVVNPEDLDRLYPRYPMPQDLPNEDDGPRRAKRSPYGRYVSEWPSEEGQGVHLIIITNNYDENGRWLGKTPKEHMTGPFHRYEQLLEDSLGITAEVKTVDQIELHYADAASTTSGRIHAFINDAVQGWSTNLVMLGGDVSVVPAPRLHGPDGIYDVWARNDPPADYWYTRVGGAPETWNSNLNAWMAESIADADTTTFLSDGFSSVGIGRIPARDSVEAVQILTKIERYQHFGGDSDFPSPDFWSTALVAAGPTNSPFPGGDQCGVWAAESLVVSNLQYPGDWSIHRLYPDYRSIKLDSGCPNHDNVCYWQLNDYIESHVSPSDGVKPKVS